MQSYEDNQDGLNTRTFDGVEGAVDFAISLQADLEKVLAKPQTPKADIVRNAKNLSESIRVILFLIRMELKSRKLADTCEAELEREP